MLWLKLCLLLFYMLFAMCWSMASKTKAHWRYCWGGAKGIQTGMQTDSPSQQRGQSCDSLKQKWEHNEQITFSTYPLHMGNTDKTCRARVLLQIHTLSLTFKMCSVRAIFFQDHVDFGPLNYWFVSSYLPDKLFPSWCYLGQWHLAACWPLL